MFCCDLFVFLCGVLRRPLAFPWISVLAQLIRLSLTWTLKLFITNYLGYVLLLGLLILPCIMESHRCINCGVSTVHLRRHSLESNEIQSVIRQWITPRSVTASDHVCHSCWLLARETLSQPGSSESSRRVGHHHVCIICGRSLLRIRFHTLTNISERNRAIYDIISEWTLHQQLSPSSAVCHPCWQRADRAQQQQRRRADGDDLPPPGPEPPRSERSIILPDYSRASDTQSHCFVLGCPNHERLHIPLVLRQLLLKEHHFYVPINCRVCSFHLIGNEWSFLNGQEYRNNHSFTAAHIQDMMIVLKTGPETINFNDINTIPDHLIYYWLGRTKEEVSRILSEVPRLAQMSRGTMALAAYLIKIRTGDSFDRLSTLFAMSKTSIIRLISQAREILVQDYVPLHLGLNHINREQVAQRNLLIPNGLFGNQGGAITIMDGTYIYVQKSSNYLFQKNTYSLHKYRNLVKVFMIVSTDGYIIEVLGPYKATTSDADITKHEFRDNQPLRNYFQENDVFVLDRGFRDALPVLRNSGFRTYVPASLREGETQLSTLDANKSRAVTICRWVVEVVNGRFKRDFKIFRQEYYNSTSKNLMKDFSVGAALTNAFHPLVRDRDDAGEILAIINNKMYTQNTLAELVLTNNLNRRRTDFVRINVTNNNVSDFPQLTYSELLLVSLGTYQIKQARSYYGEHIRPNGSYTIEVCRESSSSLLRELSNRNAWILRGKIQSRHVSRKTYFIYILLDSSLNGRDAILQHYCNCIVGKRTVGCCAHIMSIVWYLGWARFQTNVNPPAPQLDDLLIVCETANVANEHE